MLEYRGTTRARDGLAFETTLKGQVKGYGIVPRGRTAVFKDLYRRSQGVNRFFFPAIIRTLTTLTFSSV